MDPDAGALPSHPALQPGNVPVFRLAAVSADHRHFSVSVVCIFSATTTSVTEEPATIMEMLETQPTSFARLQFFWLLAGIVAHVRGNVLQL